MAQIKSDLSIAIKIGNESFTLNCVQLPDSRFLVKRGRNVSEKMPYATVTDIYEAARKWTVSRLKLPRVMSL